MPMTSSEQCQKGCCDPVLNQLKYGMLKIQMKSLRQLWMMDLLYKLTRCFEQHWEWHSMSV